MAVERTFSIIKPDATERNLTGAVNAMIEQAGLRIVAQKRVRITREQAETFYGVHRERPFFGELVDVHDLGAGRGAGARRRRRDRAVPRRDGRDRSVQGGGGHDPQGPRAVDRRELGARFRRAGHRRRRRSRSSFPATRLSVRLPALLPRPTVAGSPCPIMLVGPAAKLARHDC